METYSTKVSLNSTEEEYPVQVLSDLYTGPRCPIKKENRGEVPYNFSLELNSSLYVDFSLAPDDALKMAFGIIDYYAASKQDAVVDFCSGKVGL